VAYLTVRSQEDRNATSVFLHPFVFRNGTGGLRPGKFVRLADTASPANGSPRASQSLVSFDRQNAKRPDPASSLANPRSGRDARVATPGRRTLETRRSATRPEDEAAEIKHWEDEAPNANETPAQIEEAVKRAKSDMESATNLEQQRQAIETEAELQLRTEKEKLNALETQLDELVRNMSDPSAQPGSVPR
jgi:hypothetical protein